MRRELAVISFTSLMPGSQPRNFPKEAVSGKCWSLHPLLTHA